MSYRSADLPFTIQSVIFGDQWIEINYVKTRDVDAPFSERTLEIHQRLVRPNEVEVQADDVYESLCEMLDIAYRIERGTPDSFTPISTHPLGASPEG